MAYFNVDDLDVSPSEFLEACSDSELRETYDSLINDYGMEGEENEETVREETVRSEGQRNFNRYLRALKESWISVSKEDGQIIEVLGKKYGAV